MSRAVLLVVVTTLLCSASAQVADPISAECLQCICYATSDCDVSGGCSEDTCGPYGITWEYWADAARPVLPPDNPFVDGAYVKCTTNKQCSERTLQNYMLRYARDCNGDGGVSCYDFAAIHRIGGDTCGGRLDEEYINKLAACFQQFQIQ